MLRLSDASPALRRKATQLLQMNERAARGFRLEKERVIAGLRNVLGEDRSIEPVLLFFH
jgi:hypothetical protein